MPPSRPLFVMNGKYLPGSKNQGHGFKSRSEELYSAHSGMAQAEVLVDGESAGLWLTAGANTVMRSDPPREGEAVEAQAITAGGRKLKQDEFLLPPELTRNKTALTLQFANRPHAISELWPGRGPLKRHGLWCESDMEVYCFSPAALTG